MPRFLELRRKHLAGFQRRNGERDQRGRYVQIQEGAGHGVFTANGGGAQLQLRVHSAQQSREGFAPALRLIAELLKELLEGEINFFIVRTGGHQLGHRGVDCVVGPGVGVSAGLLRVAAPGHDTGLIRFLTGQDGEHGGHGLRRGALRSATEGHEDGTGTDGAVKPLHKAAAGGAFQAGGHLPEGLEPGRCKLSAVLLCHTDPGVLHSAVGVQEVTAQVGDDRAVPLHDHPGFFRDHGHPVGFQIFRFGGGDEGVHIFGGHHHGHALLRFGDGQLRAVQTVILLANGVQIDPQAVRQLADGNADAAGAKVVAPLDEAGHGAVPEQALDLALLGGVALLNLGGHGGKGFQVVALGRTSCAADAVPSGAAAQQNDHISGGGTLTADVIGGSRRNHRAAFQTLGDVALVVQLCHMAGGQTDLVAVGGIARRGGLAQLPLGQLAGEGLVQGGAGVSRTGHPHGLMDIGTAGQGVPDAAADAGGRAAEGLDLRGVVVGLIFEHQQPVLGLAVHRGGDMDRAGIDLLALVQLRQQAPLFQDLRADGGNVHQGLRPLGGLFLAVDLHPCGQIPLVGGLNGRVMNFHLVDVGGEGGVAAVVGPVGVYHPDLGDGGVPPLVIPEIALQKFQIVQIHGKTQLVPQSVQRGSVHGGEALHGPDGGRNIVFHPQGLRQLQRRLPALHRVDDILLDSLDLLRRQLTLQDVYPGGADRGPLALG